MADLDDDVAHILAAVQGGQLVLERQLFEGLGYLDEVVDRLDLGGDEVLGVRRWVVFDDHLAVSRVDDEFSLDRQAGHDVGFEGGAGADPSHVDAHLTEHLYVHAATITASPSHMYTRCV